MNECPIFTSCATKASKGTRVHTQIDSPNLFLIMFINKTPLNRKTTSDFIWCHIIISKIKLAVPKQSYVGNRKNRSPVTMIIMEYFDQVWAVCRHCSREVTSASQCPSLVWLKTKEETQHRGLSFLKDDTYSFYYSGWSKADPHVTVGGRDAVKPQHPHCWLTLMREDEIWKPVLKWCHFSRV